ncbi:hypothetical protein [Fructilactobacillus florum]|uniref:hypothetical protein n=1 Tax=Fructilactobacillus florum TaxID=640331 RepID=UPI0006D225BB|nr:hypothetical protein [Fructilactobacillus florum]
MSKRRYVILLRKVSKVCDGLVLGLDHSYVPGFVRSDTFNDSMMLRSDWLSTKKELKADPITSKMMDHLAVVNEYGTEVTLVSDLKKQKKQIKLPEKNY